MLTTLALEVVLRSGARLGLTARGDLVTAGLPPELLPLVEENAARLAQAVAGMRPSRTTDGAAKRHRWRVCSACGQEALTATGGGRCRMVPGHVVNTDRKTWKRTIEPGCKGTYVDPAPRDLLGLPCARPGCDLPAAYLTAGLEPLCSPDLAHLALANEYRRSHP